MHLPNTPKQHLTKTLIEEETRQRITRIDQEFADGFDIVNADRKTVTFFGSARLDETNQHYKKAREFAGRLAGQGYTVVTGGGGGIMEAGNRGAYEAGGKSIGLNIKLPHEQTLNSYTTQAMPFHYFFTRKVLLAYGAEAYVYFPGGFGTLDELFEIITLIQTGKMPKAPVILMGVQFWHGLETFIQEQLLAGEHTISSEDESIYTVTDSIDEAIELINAHYSTPDESREERESVHELTRA